MEDNGVKKRSLVFAVIMAGGAGTRFWPKSRLKNPKQFLKLLGKASLLGDTVRRATMLVEPKHCFVLTHKQYQDQVHESIPEISPHNIIFEPANRDTASCVVLPLNCQIGPRGYYDDFPSDHYIGHETAFIKTVKRHSFAEKHNCLMTLGIKPDSPQTGYGYIWWWTLCWEKGYPIYQVKFTEKPDQGTAVHFLKQEIISGIAGFYLEDFYDIKEIEKHLPELWEN